MCLNFNTPACPCSFASDVKKIGCVINLHDSCAANKIINNKQHTVTCYVDDVKSLHVSPKVNDKFAIWYEEKCVSDDLGHAAVTRVKHRDYLGMDADYTRNKVVLIYTTEYVEQMKEDFPEKLEKNTKA